MLTKLPVIRFLHLRAAGRSLAHAHAALLGDEADPTTSIERGAGFHGVVLGKAEVIAYPGAVRRGKEWESFKAAHPGVEIMTATEYEKVMRMAEAVRRCRRAMELLEGEREQTVTWNLHGLDCRGTPDVRHPGRVVELKSTRDASPERFTRQALSLAYHAQLAWYLDGVVASGVGRPTEAFVVAAESAPPHPVTVLRLTERTIEKGRGLYHLWLERLVGGIRANEWPGYVQSDVDLDVPDEVELDYGETAADSAADSLIT